MNKFKASYILANIIAFTCLLSGCASLAGYQDAKTLGKGNMEVAPSLNVSRTAGFLDEVDIDEAIIFPYVEVYGRYGVSDKFDVGARFNTYANVGINGKYMLLGNSQSKNAFALGAEIGNFGATGVLWNVQIPLYFSTHPANDVAIYFSPKFIYQFEVNEGTGLQYYGGNSGILLGSRIKYGFDFGYYLLRGQKSENISLFTAGFGVKFFFGDEANATNFDGEVRKKPKRNRN